MISVELLKEKDIDEICVLEEICFPEDPWGRLSFENEIDNPLSFFLVARDEETNELIAYGGVLLIYDSGDITNIAVHPQYRREGIGRRILSILTDICTKNEMKDITLEVNENNIAAQKLYETEGFQVCGRRKKYYCRKYDAIIMTKSLRG